MSVIFFKRRKENMKIQVRQNKPIYFCADYHLSHKNILKYANRPYVNVEEMNSGIVAAHNKKVEKDATVIFCGDFCFSNSEDILDFISKLNGNFVFVKGNHDNKFPKNIVMYDVVEFAYQGNYFFCSHYAHRVWNLSHHGSIHLYGHSHGSLEDDKNALSMDVGIDCHPNHEPFSVEEILEFMKTKTWKPVDHHGSSDKLKEKIGEE